jgi:hypothetical protein
MGCLYISPTTIPDLCYLIRLVRAASYISLSHDAGLRRLCVFLDMDTSRGGYGFIDLLVAGR